jgi:NAD+ kinase
MKVAVVGLARKLIESKLPEYDLKLDKKNPDVVISFGGDGTALYAERIYPGIPRVMIRHSKICEKCKIGEHDFSKVLNALKEKKYKVVEEIKVEGIVNNDYKKKLVGLNEISIHHKIPNKTIRLRIKVNGKVVSDLMIGDGIVVATPYGSTAYFYSITRKKFSKGLGLAFNNSKELMKPLILSDDSIVEAEVVRGYGLVTADNDERVIPIKTGYVLKVQKSKEKAKIIEIK